MRGQPPRCCLTGAATTVLFDADGTLLESLPPHVTFCRMLNSELGLSLELPHPDDLEGCRRIAAAPMDNFFREAGFPESVVPECVALYEGRFATECPVRPYAGVGGLLSRLSTTGVRCGVVSSNTEKNVRTGLGRELASHLEFVDGIDNAPSDKADAIDAALARMGVPAADAIYVGDTRKDAAKAAAAGVAFVGVDYGFEPLATSDEIGGAPVVSTVSELEALLMRACAAVGGHGACGL